MNTDNEVAEAIKQAAERLCGVTNTKRRTAMFRTLQRMQEQLATIVEDIEIFGADEQ